MEIQPPSDRELAALIRSEAQRLELMLGRAEVAEILAQAGGSPVLALKQVRQRAIGEVVLEPEHHRYRDISAIGNFILGAFFIVKFASFPARQLRLAHRNCGGNCVRIACQIFQSNSRPEEGLRPMMAVTHMVVAVAGTTLILSDVSPATMAISIGASQLPDLDTTQSLSGRLLLPVSSYIEETFGHRSVTHSLLMTGALSAISGISSADGIAVETLRGATSGAPVTHDPCVTARTKQGIQMMWPSKYLVCVGPQSQSAYCDGFGSGVLVAGAVYRHPGAVDFRPVGTNFRARYSSASVSSRAIAILSLKAISSRKVTKALPLWRGFSRAIALLPQGEYLRRSMAMVAS